MKFFRRVRRLVRLATIGLTVAAISQEMQKAPSDRTWTGMVFGVVPYDFRPPTWERLRDAFWNPDDPRLGDQLLPGPDAPAGGLRQPDGPGGRAGPDQAFGEEGRRPTVAAGPGLGPVVGYLSPVWGLAVDKRVYPGGSDLAG